MERVLTDYSVAFYTHDSQGNRICLFKREISPQSRIEATRYENQGVWVDRYIDLAQNTETFIISAQQTFVVCAPKACTGDPGDTPVAFFDENSSVRYRQYGAWHFETDFVKVARESDMPLHIFAGSVPKLISKIHVDDVADSVDYECRNVWEEDNQFSDLYHCYDQNLQYSHQRGK